MWVTESLIDLRSHDQLNARICMISANWRDCRWLTQQVSMILNACQLHQSYFNSWDAYDHCICHNMAVMFRTCAEMALVWRLVICTADLDPA